MNIKTLPFLFLILMSFATTSGAEPEKKSSEEKTADSILGVQTAAFDLHGKLPEDFDWKAYFESGDQSTGGQMDLARAAVAVMKHRIDELCTRYRALMTKHGDKDAVKVFDQMQEYWQKAADAEVEFVGSAWDGGSGAKEVYPKQRFKVYLRWVKVLRDLESDSMFLNQ